MGKIIRRTITITITETWTITWVMEDEPPAQTTTVAQDKSKEEPDKLLQATVIATEPTPAPVTEPPPDGMSIQPAATGRSRRTRRRRGAGSDQRSD